MNEINHNLVDKLIVLGIAEKQLSNTLFSNPELRKSDKLPGAYIIFHIGSKNVYIGSSGDLYRRLIKHKSMLNKGTHKNKNLQKEFDRHENKNMIFITYPTSNKEEATTLEQNLLDSYNGNPRLLNIATDALIAQNGQKHTDETRTKLRAAMARRIVDPGFGKHMSEVNRKRFTNPEIKKQQSDLIKRAWQNPKTREAMLAANQRKRKPLLINNVEYTCAGEAAKILNVNKALIVGRIKSRHWPLWVYK